MRQVRLSILPKDTNTLALTGLELTTFVYESCSVPLDHMRKPKTCEKFFFVFFLNFCKAGNTFRDLILKCFFFFLRKKGVLSKIYSNLFRESNLRQNPTKFLFWGVFWIITKMCLMGGNWQKWKRVFLTCPCHEIYRDEAVGLKSCKNTWKITIFVKMWNLGQYRENLIFCQ